MKIKSLDELIKIREEHSNKVNLRQQGKSTGDQIEILVGMATCGISSGARETFNALFDEINKQNLNNVKIVSVGCLGYCHLEPMIQVNVPNKKSVFYGNVKKDKVHEIIESHIKGEKPVDEMVINIDFDRA
jgi:NADP-reducing hydrogenase subunit HndB